MGITSRRLLCQLKGDYIMTQDEKIAEELVSIAKELSAGKEEDAYDLLFNIDTPIKALEGQLSNLKKRSEKFRSQMIRLEKQFGSGTIEAPKLLGALYTDFKSLQTNVSHMMKVIDRVS